MSNQTLTTPDVAVGEIIQVEVQNGDGTRIIQVIGGSGGGGGAVSSVASGGAPIVVSPTTGAVIVSIDASYPAVADFWPFDRPIARTVATPTLSQAAQTDATAPPIIIARASDAHVGSGNTGGTWHFYNGITDGAGAPAQFQVLQARASPLADAVLITAFRNDSTLVTSIGLGDGALAGTDAGTQLVLQGQANSVVCHGEAPGKGTLSLFALDNPNSGQASLTIHDFDSSGLVTGAFDFRYDVFSAPGLGDTGVYVQRNVHALGTLASRYIDVQTATPPAAAVRRWALEEGASGEANATWYDTNGVTTANGDAFIRWPWKGSTTVQRLIYQRDSGDTQDLPIIQRISGTLFFANQAEGTVRYETLTNVFFENIDATPGLGGWFYSNASQGIVFHIEPAQHSIFAGGGNTGHDGDLLSATAITNVAATTPATIATIPLQDNCVTVLEVTVNGSDTVTTTDFVGARITNTFAKNGGVITSPNNNGPGPITLGDTTAAHGTVATLALVPSLGNILVQINTWGAHTIHYVTTWKGSINARTA